MIHVVQVFRHFKRGTPGFKMTLPAIKDISEIFQVLYSWTEKASSGVVSSTQHYKTHYFEKWQGHNKPTAVSIHTLRILHVRDSVRKLFHTEHTAEHETKKGKGEGSPRVVVP